jgi:hypothetical protein
MDLVFRLQSGRIPDRRIAPPFGLGDGAPITGITRECTNEFGQVKSQGRPKSVLRFVAQIRFGATRKYRLLRSQNRFEPVAARISIFFYQILTIVPAVAAVLQKRKNASERSDNRKPLLLLAKRWRSA